MIREIFDTLYRINNNYGRGEIRKLIFIRNTVTGRLSINVICQMQYGEQEYPAAIDEHKGKRFITFRGQRRVLHRSTTELPLPDIEGGDNVEEAFMK